MEPPMRFLPRPKSTKTSMLSSRTGVFLTAAAEMQFASRIGIRLTLDSLLEAHGATVLNTLFNEELGALIQVPSDRVKEVVAEMRAAGLATAATLWVNLSRATR